MVASDQSSKRKKASRASRSSKASSVNLKFQKDGVNVAGMPGSTEFVFWNVFPFNCDRVQ